MTLDQELSPYLLSAGFSSLACALILFYIAFRDPKIRAYQWWAISFALTTAHLLMTRQADMIGFLNVNFLVSNLAIFSSLALIYGVNLFFKLQIRHSFFYGAGLINLIWSIAFGFVYPDPVILISPVYLFSGILLFFTCHTIYRTKINAHKRGGPLFMIGLALAGISHLIIPILIAMDFDFIISLLFHMVIQPVLTMGLIVLAFEREADNDGAVIRDLRNMNNRYENVISGSDSGYWDWDLKRDLIYFSDRLLDITAAPKGYQHMRPEQVLELIHPEDRGYYRQAMDAHLSGELSFFRCEFRLKETPERDSEVWLLTRGIAKRNRQGEAISIAGAMQDITQQKKQEISLIAANEAVEVANRSKTEFLANMSHELRTPLNSIIGFSDILKAQSFGAIGNSRYVDYAATINMAGKHLLSLIGDILDVSRIETGQTRIFERNLDLSEVANSCHNMISSRAFDKGVSLTIHAPKDLPFLFADETRLKQMLLNLLTNSVKFTPRGGRATLDISIDQEDSVIIQVIDTGIGIARKDLPRSLSRFGQKGTSYTRHQDRMGLGLSLVQIFAALHNASFVIESNVGQGTEAVITFPPERTIRTNRHIQEAQEKSRSDLGDSQNLSDIDDDEEDKNSG